MVLVASGHSFERPHLLKWLMPNRICPITRKPVDMSGIYLIENWNLKGDIQAWRADCKAKMRQVLPFKSTLLATPDDELHLAQCSVPYSALGLLGIYIFSLFGVVEICEMFFPSGGH